MNISASLVFKNRDTISSAQSPSDCDRWNNPRKFYFLSKETI